MPIVVNLRVFQLNILLSNNAKSLSESDKERYENNNNNNNNK